MFQNPYQAFYLSHQGQGNKLPAKQLPLWIGHVLEVAHVYDFFGEIWVNTWKVVLSKFCLNSHVQRIFPRPFWNGWTLFSKNWMVEPLTITYFLKLYHFLNLYSNLQLRDLERGVDILVATMTDWLIWWKRHVNIGLLLTS